MVEAEQPHVCPHPNVACRVLVDAKYVVGGGQSNPIGRLESVYLVAVVAAQAATYRAVPKETVAALEYGMYVCHGKLRLCGQHLDRECLIVGRRLLREEIHTLAQNEQ